MNKENIVKIEKEIAENHDNISGIVVLKNGKTLYENYFNNCDTNTRIHVYAVTKSIVSILVGIAIDKGYIESVEQKVLDFFPDYNVRAGEKKIQQVTIKNMLTMTAPYNHGIFAPYLKYFESQDWLNFSLDELGGKGKVGKFRYSPLIGPDILSGILEKATGQAVLDFAKEHLFEPLGIVVERNIDFFDKEDQIEFSESTTLSGWVSDSTGLNAAGWGLTLSPVDMAKIGQLYINKGVWNNNKIVSSSWVEESLQSHIKWWRNRINSGYLWWVLDAKERTYAALGDGGNVIYLNMSKNLVVSIAAIYKGKAKDRIKFIKKYIEPVV